MSKVTLPEEGRDITGAAAIAAFLEPYGIQFEQWEATRDVSDGATDDEILEAYAPDIERLKARGGYAAADVINVTPETPNLDAMLDKFNKEHTHADDEVRFVVKGRGVFHIRPRRADGGYDPVFGIEMDAGDLINVPAGTQHWFDLCSERTIRAIRLFKDTSGWTPEYIEDGVHERYVPVCWGPEYLASGGLRERVQPLDIGLGN